MYQALYRKWRPQTFSDVVGQEHITSVLQYQIEQNRVSHAYLFCGSRGTGKTTCAKLLAKAVNCTNLQNGNPCNQCEACLSVNSGTALDVAELDAASNNKVEDVRRLCDEVIYPPASLSKRVYIVDEVHMLTTQAFNALLKTLEEPPAHAIFILATTELQKVPATIVSRCQRFDFSRIRKEKIVDRLMHICSVEGINLDREAAFVIANLSDGAMRDALSLLESCASKGAYISTEYVINLLGLSNREQLLELIYSASNRNTTRALALLEELYTKNGDLTTCFTELLDLCRDILIIQNVSSPRTYINTTDDEFKRLKEIADSSTPETIGYFVSEIERFISDTPSFGMNKKAAAEIAVIKMTSPLAVETVEALASRLSQLEKALDNPQVITEQAEKPREKKKQDKKDNPLEEKPLPKPVKSGNREIFEHVNEFVRLFGEREPMTKFFVASAMIKKEGTTLKIYCSAIGASTMKMSNAHNTALEIAKSLDDSIVSVELISSDAQDNDNEKKNEDLSQFED
jgi:DNA polymerase-3 subunit gamma/tau